MRADWVEFALCREVGPELFERPDEDTVLGRSHRYTEARRVCARCVVRAQCLDEAMRIEGGNPTEHRSGMYGGMSPRQRANHYPDWRLEEVA